jgi:GDPmannose 4,6-dehydratase
MILDSATADDFILASGTTHSVRDITQTAFASLGLDWKQYVRSEEHLLRPADPVHLRGDASKARTVLGWQPQSSVHDLIAEMTHVFAWCFAQVLTTKVEL